MDQNHIAADAQINSFLRAQHFVTNARKLHNTNDIRRTAILNITKKHEIDIDKIYNLTNPEFKKLRDLVMCDVNLEVQILSIKLEEDFYQLELFNFPSQTTRI